MLVDTGRTGRLHVEQRGDGEPIVLWHSLLCDGRMWEGQVPALARTRRVVCIDAPGHGRSGRVREPYTLDDCVDAALAVMDATGVGRAAFCGLSWGGMVGMRLSARAPDRVSALVLMDTSARAERPWKKGPYRVLAAIARRIGPPAAMSRGLSPIMFGDETLRRRRDLVDRFVAGLCAMDPPSLGHAVDAVIFDRGDVLDRLGAIRCPTLVVVGEQDRATPIHESRRIVERIDGATLVTIPGAGHLSAWEEPRRVNDALLGFLSDPPGASARP